MLRQLMRRAHDAHRERRRRHSVSTFMGLSATTPTPSSVVARTFQHFSGVSCRRRRTGDSALWNLPLSELENHMRRAFTEAGRSIGNCDNSARGAEGVGHRR